MFKKIALTTLGVFNGKDSKKIVAQSESDGMIAFNYDPENFVYFRTRAITADEPNQNGDYFPEEEIKKAYKTFIGVGLYKDHNSDSVDKSIGKVVWAEYVPEGKYVECICAVDKNLDPNMAYKVKQGIVNSVSMGCSVAEVECSICGNIAHSPEELCEHMVPGRGVKGRYVNGQLAYEINRNFSFVELSLVNVPADPTARVFEVYAKAKGDGRPDVNPSDIIPVYIMPIKSLYKNKFQAKYIDKLHLSRIVNNLPFLKKLNKYLSSGELSIQDVDNSIEKTFTGIMYYAINIYNQTGKFDLNSLRDGYVKISFVDKNNIPQELEDIFSLIGIDIEKQKEINLFDFYKKYFDMFDSYIMKRFALESKDSVDYVKLFYFTNMAYQDKFFDEKNLDKLNKNTILSISKDRAKNDLEKMLDVSLAKNEDTNISSHSSDVELSDKDRVSLSRDLYSVNERSFARSLSLIFGDNIHNKELSFDKSILNYYKDKGTNIKKYFEDLVASYKHGAYGESPDVSESNEFSSQEKNIEKSIDIDTTGEFSKLLESFKSGDENKFRQNLSKLLEHAIDELDISKSKYENLSKRVNELSMLSKFPLYDKVKDIFKTLKREKLSRLYELFDKIAGKFNLDKDKYGSTDKEFLDIAIDSNSWLYRGDTLPGHYALINLLLVDGEEMLNEYRAKYSGGVYAVEPFLYKDPSEIKNISEETFEKLLESKDKNVIYYIYPQVERAFNAVKKFIDNIYRLKLDKDPKVEEILKINQVNYSKFEKWLKDHDKYKNYSNLLYPSFSKYIEEIEKENNIIMDRYNTETAYSAASIHLKNAMKIICSYLSKGEVNTSINLVDNYKINNKELDDLSREKLYFFINIACNYITEQLKYFKLKVNLPGFDSSLRSEFNIYSEYYNFIEHNIGDVSKYDDMAIRIINSSGVINTMQTQFQVAIYNKLVEIGKIDGDIKPCDWEVIDISAFKSKSSYNINYIPGKSMKDSYFEFDDGITNFKYSSKDIIPLSVQEDIINGKTDMSPEDYIYYLYYKFSTLSDIKKFAFKVASKNNKMLIKYNNN